MHEYFNLGSGCKNDRSNVEKRADDPLQKYAEMGKNMILLLGFVVNSLTSKIILPR